MLTYKSSYKPADAIWIGVVLDFPGTIAYGESLDRARQNLALALRDMAETNLLQGERLPIPDPTRCDPDADIEEPIHLVLQAGQQISTTVRVAAS